MFKNIVHFFLSASLSPAEFKEISPAIAKNNFRALRAYSVMATFFFFFAAIVAYITQIPNMLDKAPAYTFFGIFSILTLTITLIVNEKKPRLLQALSFAFYIMLLTFGLYVSLVSSPNQLTVSLIGLYMIAPLLFVVRPYQIFLMSQIADIAFLILCPSMKPHDIIGLDMVNNFTFCNIGIFVGMFTVKQKYQRMVYEKRVAQFSTRDLLAHNLRSIADIYISMHQINLENGTFNEIHSNKVINSNIDHYSDNYSKQIVHVLTAMTKPEYLSGMLQFIDVNSLQERLKGKRSITLEFQGRHSGWCRARFIAIGPIGPDIAPTNVIFAVENINEQKNLESTLITKAETDAMTGLLNRQAGIEKITKIIKDNKQGMLALFDVDKFKRINDTYGHQMGDKVIIAVAKAMQETFRGEDITMRLGGDEYIFFVQDVNTEERGVQIIQRFFDAISNIKFSEVKDLSIELSLGATFIQNNQNIDFEEYYHRIDSCTYKSKKKEGKAYTFWKKD